MILKDAKLDKKLLLKDIGVGEIRDGCGEGLVIAGENDSNVVVITADLKESTRVGLFADKFPDRFFDTGVAEQALVTIASGMANYGKIPFISSYSIFSVGRAWEQIRTTVCMNNVPVKIIGGHAGLSAGLDGGTHQALEDIFLTRALPNMVVIVPCDREQAKLSVIEASKTKKPTYIRIFKGETPIVTTFETPFQIGRCDTYWESKDPKTAIIACGNLVYEALIAARDLEKIGINTLVINCHTIKPMDKQGIIRAAKTCGSVVTVEEHQIIGGLGSAVSEVLAQNFPVPIEMVGINDTFGVTGKPDELRKKFGLTAKDITEAVKRIITRKEDK